MRRNVPPSRLASGVVLVVGMLVALLLAGALVQPGLADDGAENVTIERVDDELHIGVNEAEIEPGESIHVTIDTSDGSEELNTSWSPDSSTDKFEADIDLFDPPNNESLPAQTDLSDATVLVRVGNTTVEKPETDLRAIRVGSGDVRVDGSSLLITADDIVGISGDVPIEVAGDEEVIHNVEPESASQGWQLDVPLNAVHQEVDVFSSLTLEAFPGHDTATTQIAASLDLQDVVDDPAISAGDGELELVYDLVFEDEEYDIVVDEEPVTVTATEHGTLDLSPVNKTELLIDSRSLTVEKDGDEILIDVDIPLDDEAVFSVARDEVGEPKIRFDTIEHDLLFDGETYGIQIETEEPDGILTLQNTADGDGLTLPEEARQTFLAEVVSISVANEDGYWLFEDEPLDEKVSREINATVDGNYLNLTLTDSDEQLDEVESVQLNHTGTVTTLEGAFNESNSTLNVSAVDQSLETGDSATVVLFDGDGSPVAQLAVNVTESSVSDGIISGLPGGTDVVLIIAFAGVFLMGGSLLVFPRIRFPVVGQPSVAGTWLGLVVVAALVITGVLVTISVNNTFAFLIGAIAITALIFGLFDWRRNDPTDKLALLLAGALGLSFTGIVLLVITVLEVELLGGVAGSAYGILFGISLAIWDGKRQAAKQQSAGTRQPQTVDVTVTLVDAVTKNRINSDVRVTARQRNNRGLKELSVSNGTATGSLPTGTWTFTVETPGGAEITKERQQRVSQRQNTARIAIPGKKVTVQVRTEQGEAVPRADVAVNSPGYDDPGTTNSRGSYTTKLPFETTNVEIAAEHQLYKPNSQSMNLGNRDETATLTLVPRTGGLRVTASLGRESVSGVSVTATRRSSPEDTASGTTNASGVVEFADLLIGEYDLDVELPIASEAFSISAGTASITEGRTDRQDVTIRFEYALSHRHKQRIRDLRDELQGIARSSRRDDAIQSYYASVLHAVLDEVERIPRSGYPFLEHNQDPDSVVEALLDATEEATATMDEVLSSQRNVNLFSACADLPDANIEWRGSADIATLLRDANRDVGQQRADVNTQLEQVDERITAELRELAEVSPAREMWDGVRDMLRDQSGLDEIEVAASIFVALLVLDAIDSVFEQRELRKRLEQTVY